MKAYIKLVDGKLRLCNWNLIDKSISGLAKIDREECAVIKEPLSEQQICLKINSLMNNYRELAKSFINKNELTEAQVFVDLYNKTEEDLEKIKNLCKGEK